MLANGDALSRDEICKLTLGHSDTSNCLSVTVARLREKLGAQARQLVTLKGFGFRLDMDEAENGRKR